MHVPRFTKQKLGLPLLLIFAFLLVFNVIFITLQCLIDDLKRTSWFRANLRIMIVGIIFESSRQ